MANTQWTPDEDAYLMYLVDSEKRNWWSVHKLTGKPLWECIKRHYILNQMHRHTVNHTKAKHSWTSDEDIHLADLVDEGATIGYISRMLKIPFWDVFDRMKTLNIYKGAYQGRCQFNGKYKG